MGCVCDLSELYGSRQKHPGYYTPGCVVELSPSSVGAAEGGASDLNQFTLEVISFKEGTAYNRRDGVSPKSEREMSVVCTRVISTIWVPLGINIHLGNPAPKRNFTSTYEDQPIISLHPSETSRKLTRIPAPKRNFT